MSIDLLPAAPDPATMTAQQFSLAAAAMVLAQKAMVPQINAAIAGIGTIAAGGAFAIPYTYRVPGFFTSGRVALDNAVPASATLMYISHTDVMGLDALGQVTQMAASTSTIKGFIRLVKVGDASKFLIFAITGRTDYTTYSGLAITLVNSGGISSPFSDNDSVVAFFQRTGDKGDVGIPYNVLYLRDERASGTAAPTAGTGTTTRTINTTKVNSISGASLASNQITLPAGTYDFTIFSTIASIVGQMYLYNVTDAGAAIYGVPHVLGATQTGVTVLQGRLTIASAKVFEVRHVITATGSGNTFGTTASSGSVEIFLDICITKGS